MKYGHLFLTQQEHDQAYVNRAAGGDYIEPWVGYITEEDKVSYDKEYSKKYLTFEALEDGTFKFSGNSVDYSMNGGETWTTLASDTSTPTVAAGGTIMFKTTATASSEGTGTFSSTGRFNVMGNAYSIGYGDNFENVTSLSRNYYLKKLFYGCTKLVSAEHLILQATSLSTRCYYHMFSGCTALTIGPELPATTLKAYCYYGMFNSCQSLKMAPELPATVATEGCYGYMFDTCLSLKTAPELPAQTTYRSCYQNMFFNCTLLTKAPVLPAATLTENCYYRMFYGCSRLNYIKMLATDISANGCLSSWVYNVSPTGTFVKNYVMTDLPTGTSGIPTGWTVGNELSDYLKIKALGAGNVIIAIPPEVSGSMMTSISYSKDGLNWTDTAIDDTDQTINIQVAKSDTVYLKGSGSTMGNGTNRSSITCRAEYNVCGNIMSLLYDEQFGSKKAFPVYGQNYNFEYLFYNSTTLKRADDLILPALTTYTGSYRAMFAGCTALTHAPELPATSLGHSSYLDMFRGCISLIKPPSSIYGNGAWSCGNMFHGCISLTDVPELPTTSLGSSCYYGMFANCTSLVSAPALPALSAVYMCYTLMFSGCTALTQPPELPATSLNTSCYMQMFYGCTSLTSPPELNATTLKQGCYREMFVRCTSLLNPPALPATALTTNCYYQMFRECTSLTSAPVLPAATLADGCYQEMFYQASHINYIKMLATDISATNCLTNWTNGVSATGTFVKNASMTSLPTGANGIPSGWTVQDATS